MKIKCIALGLGMLFSSLSLTAHEAMSEEKFRSAEEAFAALQGGELPKTYFVFQGMPKKNSAQLHKELRPAHIEWVKNSPIHIAGPFIDNEGNYLSSFIIFEADNQAAAEALFATDPYVKEGFFASVEIKPWKWIIGAPK